MALRYIAVEVDDSLNFDFNQFVLYLTKLDYQVGMDGAQIKLDIAAQYKPGYVSAENKQEQSQDVMHWIGTDETRMVQNP